MKAFYRHVEACNPLIEEPFLPWYIDSALVGWVRPGFADRLRAFPEVFEVATQRLRLNPAIADFAGRTAALLAVTRQLADQGATLPHLDEPYAVTPGGREAALCTIDRSAAAYFGVRSFGQHLNGFVRRADGIHMWLGRRARDRLLFPGALDNMVAGGLPHHLGLRENLLKECAEEAGLSEELAAQATPVGVISYKRVATRGLRRDLLYCYDLQLSEDWMPVNRDGEVEEFLLLPLAEVAAIVRDSDQFKLNCNLVIIDFLIRHGWFDPADPGYLDLAMGLRRSLDLSSVVSDTWG